MKYPCVTVLDTDQDTRVAHFGELTANSSRAHGAVGMLVDGGTLPAGDIVVDYVKELGYSNVDYMVVTHDHDDHVGGLVTVLDSFEVGHCG